ncbi:MULTISPECIES: GNAT family N-acetyltransferase [unclassified Fibrobacter]|uniref:GNAT family N-acetyltransferase n=1 Tax=unclassified Fibrobacter TaxID=2634177 RepID=UPI000D6D4570|nr:MULTISPECIES: GNAT family N-acetyltransferase [unclassified Fibrobacter]PWJ68315.1 phosphinothricin acetyltransferase [Fibrobacter sp. UWR4]PZW68151.1 phosphinothricin acetyltransferase [Fibrobacter sp. UWR1]
MIRIRSAKVEDASALLAIYKPYVENTAITFEYDAPSVEEFARRIRGTLEKYPYLVLERIGDNARNIGTVASSECIVDGTTSGNCAGAAEILGYCYAGVFKGRAAYNRSVETSIYVKMGEHGKGYGRALYNELDRELKARGILNAYACIASPKPGSTHLDNSSQKFHEHMGYSLVGTFHDCAYKFGQWYNMIWMEKMLGEHL